MLTEARTLTPSIAELPAGGDDPNRFDCTEVWYPIHYVEDLDRTKPTRFTLLGRDLVIWWDRQADQWRVMEDQCPHRLAPLSEGRIAEDGLLECPYHGWAFRGDGTCDRIPQQPAEGIAHQSPRACIPSLPTAVCQGLLFVYPGTPERAERVSIPVVGPLDDDADQWVCLNTFRDLPYDALTLLENVLDASHVPFTHHRSVGNRANASVVDLEVQESTRQGFTGTWAEGPRKGTLGRQNTTFIAPGLMWHDLTSKQFGRTLTVVYATPIRKGECRVFARFPFRFASRVPATVIRLTPRWYAHLGQNGVLEDDQIFLHYQERYLAAKGGSDRFAKAFYLPTRADAFVTELRKWVNAYEADPFVGEALPPAQSPVELLDRYHSHTVHCASCRRALATIQRLRLGLAIGGAIAWAGALWLTLLLAQPAVVGVGIAALVPLLAGAGGLGLGRLERQFYEGRRIPPRNRPDKRR